MVSFNVPKDLESSNLSLQQIAQIVEARRRVRQFKKQSRSDMVALDSWAHRVQEAVERDEEVPAWPLEG